MPDVVTLPVTLPLSAAQEGIWTGQQFDQDSPAFNTAEYVVINGPVDVRLFTEALRRTVGETDALNVVFRADADGRPSQRFRPDEPWPVHVVDVADADDPMAAALAWMRADLAHPVDLRADLVFCHALFPIGPELFLWYHRVHHIALDGYGLSLFARRVAEVYTALVEDREPPACGFAPLRGVVDADQSYVDSPKYLAARDYWVAKASGRPAPVVLANRTGPLSRSVVREQAGLDAATIMALRTAASGAGAMWIEAVTAAFAAYLHRMTGAPELTLALPVMTRLGSVALRVPCTVTNVVPLWVEVAAGDSLVSLTTQVAAEVRAARPHLRYRYEQLRRDLNLVASERKLFGPSVNIMPFDYGLRFAGQRGVVTNVSAGLVEDLVVHVYDRTDGSGPTIVLDANPTCYTRAELARHLRRFLTFLNRAAAAPDAPVADLDLLIDDEPALLETWNDTASDLPDVTVPDLFEAQAAATPDRTALVADGSLSFAELNARANRLARLLVERGAGPDRYVALLLPRTGDAIVALLAVLKSGAAYVPIDPDYPAKRVAMILADSAPVVLLTTENLWRDMRSATVPVVVTDAPTTVAALAELSGVDLPDAERRAPLTRAHAACLIYTSGSTGTPKGVVIEHLGLVNLFHHHRDHLIRPEAGDTVRRAALSASLSFDTSWEGLLWLLDGHELHFIDDDRRREPAAMLDYVAEHGIDFMDITPTYAEELLAAGLLDEGRRRPAVLALGGEATGPALWNALRDTDIAVYNLYGPTECTVDTLWCRLSDSADPIVGRPLTNTRAHVLDGTRRPVPPGVVGELYFAGAAVARGYHNRPELTAERFAAGPAGSERLYRTGDLARWRDDGTIEFLGRADDQVKIRGYRIELGEIESVLSGHPAVARAAVVAREDTPGLRRLVGYVVPTGAPPEPAALRQYLAERLPDYLVPPAFVAVERLPLTTNGKLDRAALPAPDQSATVAGRGPRDHRETLLCKMFADLLGLAEVGIDDDFFSLGGHSLLVGRLLGRIRAEFGVSIGIRTVFEAPTVAKLVERFGGDEGGALEVLLPLRRQGSRPPLFCVAPATGLAWSYAGLIASIGDHPVYGLQSHGIARAEPLPSSVAEAAADYVRRIREIQPDGPYHLLGWSFGGLVAHEAAVQLQRAGAEVAALVLLDSFPLPDSMRGTHQELTEADFRAEILGQHGGTLDDLDDRGLSALYRAFANNSKLITACVPGRFSGDVVLFEATEDKTPEWPGPDAWRSYVDGQVHVHRVDSTHNGITGPAPLARIGAVLTQLLEREAA
jgi:enterobactin synthetase component F